MAGSTSVEYLRKVSRNQRMPTLPRPMQAKSQASNAFTSGSHRAFAFTQRLLLPGAACAVLTRRAGAWGGIGGLRATKPVWGAPVCGWRPADEL